MMGDFPTHKICELLIWMGRKWQWESGSLYFALIGPSYCALKFKCMFSGKDIDTIC